MKSTQDVKNFIEEENIQFIKLMYIDAFGVQKNIAIMPDELERAFRGGISFDASAIAGFDDGVRSDLFLDPDPDTLTIVPWRPIEGKVARMFCDVRYPSGKIYGEDTRQILKQAIVAAHQAGIRVYFGAEVEFYLFRLDENGEPTRIPQDHASYMDSEPLDRGANIRRDICFSLIDMGIRPEASHHEQGPGQNEIDFRYSDALTAADNNLTFKWVVKSIAEANGMWADFSPKPIDDAPGNGMHLNISVMKDDESEPDDEEVRKLNMEFMAGIMEHIREITLFLNPTQGSYRRLGNMKAPGFVSWSEQNRSQLIRIPAVNGTEGRRFELRSPDPTANPYLAYAMLIYAGIDGVKRHLTPPDPVDQNLYTADPRLTETMKKLPSKLEEAIRYAADSIFVKNVLPENILRLYCERSR